MDNKRGGKSEQWAGADWVKVGSSRGKAGPYVTAPSLSKIAKDRLELGPGSLSYSKVYVNRNGDAGFLL